MTPKLFSLPLDNYECTILDWLDGDTVRVQVHLAVKAIDVAFMLVFDKTVRIYGIDTPERRGATKDAGVAAMAFAKSLAPPGSPASVNAAPGGAKDKYGRVLGVLLLPDGRNVAGVMIDAKHAKPWGGSGPKPS